MSRKKEILKKISNKQISHMREIDEKYQLDDDVLELYMKTFYDFKELNKKEKEIKTKELVDKAKNKILEYRNENPPTFEQIHKAKEEGIILKKDKDGKIVDKLNVLKLLDKKIVDSYQGDLYHPLFLKDLHPSLLNDEDIFKSAIRYDDFDNEDLSLFNENLIKKYENKTFLLEIKFKYWVGDPYFPFTKLIHHIDKLTYNIDAGKFSEGPLLEKERNRDFNVYDYLRINEAFCKLKFEKKSQNKYFNKLEQFQKIHNKGFPFQPNGSKENFKKSGNKYLADSQQIWECDIEGNPIFSGKDYCRLTMFYSSLHFLYKILKNRLSIRTDLIDSEFNEIIRLGRYDKSLKLVNFIHNFAPLVTENLEKKINKKKLEKDLIEKLNKSFLKYKFPIKLPKEQVQRFNAPLIKNKISIKKINLNEQLEYKGYDLPDTRVGISYLVQYKGLNNRLALKV